MKDKIIFHGGEYDDVDAMPESVRREYVKYVEGLRPTPHFEHESPAGDAPGDASGKPAIRFLGAAYEGVDSMPPDIRDFYEEVNRDSNGDGIPDSIQRRRDRDTTESTGISEDELDGRKEDTLSHARKREKAYLSLSLYFLAFSPLAMWGLSLASPEPLLHFDTLTLIVALTGFVLAGLVDFLMGRGTGKPIWSRIWVRDPVARSENEVRLDRGILMQEIARRLRYVGLSLVSRDDASNTHRPGVRGRTRELEFEGYPVSVRPSLALGERLPDLGETFVNYRATGSLSIQPMGRGFLIHGEITRLGLVLVDTGQRRRLRSVIEYLTLKTRESECQEISFVVVYGLCMVFTAITAGVLALLDPFLWGPISVRASCVGVIGLVVGRAIQLSYLRSAGNKLVYMGLLLAVILWLRPVSNMFF